MLIALMLSVASPLAQAQDLTPVAVGWDVVPMVGTSSWSRGGEVRSLSLNLVGGYAGAVEGVELSSVFSIDRLHMQGIQLSGAANLVGAGVDGVQMAGALNVVGQSVDGVQMAGGVNLVAGSLDGVQGSGGLNVVALGVDGVQAAGGANITGAGVEGVQASGALNVAGGVVDGLQASGGLNVAGGIDGAQVAPLNFSGGHVEGVQIGVINIARTSDFSLGVINIILEGRTHLDAWTTESGLSYVALKHGGEGFHYIYGAGYRPGAGDLPYAWSAVLGIGGHSTIGHRLFVDGDLLAQNVNEGVAWSKGLNLLNTARLVGGVRLFDRLAVVAGPSYNVLVSSDCGPRYAGPGVSVFSDGPVEVRGWPGWMLGIELL